MATNYQRAMRGFLGLTRYYHKFIQDYGKIAAPLTNMLKKNSFTWTPVAETAFQRLKEVMTKAPVLALPNFNHTFIIECDASSFGIGFVLSNPIAIHSQALHGKNLLLSTYEKEMLSLVMVFRKWRSYLLGRKFVIRTDLQSILGCMFVYNLTVKHLSRCEEMQSLPLVIMVHFRSCSV